MKTIGVILATGIASVPLAPVVAVPTPSAAGAVALVAAKADRGSLKVVARGVPRGRSAKITVAGRGTRKKVPRAGTLRNLRPGMYRVWAAPIVAQGGTAAVPNLPLRIKVRKKKSAVLRMRFAWNPKTDSYPPGPASALKVVGRDLDRISLQWVNGTAPDLQAVEVRRRIGAQAPQSLEDGKVVDVDRLGTAVTDEDLRSHTAYSYSVFMVDTAGNASRPVSVTARTAGIAVAVSAGTAHSCALLRDTDSHSDLSDSGGIDLIGCWGDNQHAQIGDGSLDDALEPVTVALHDAVQVAAGGEHTCARQSGGAVWCWGRNAYGQLGLGTVTDVSRPARVALPDAVDVAVGGEHTCAVLRTGSVRCWGRNDHGQLGVPPSERETHPTSVPGVANAVSITAGFAHTCVVLNTGSVRCWGRNDHGQLGNNSTDDSAVPVRPVLSSVAALSAGVFHTCALLADDSASCWGANTYGQVGDGTGVDRPAPVEVPGSGVSSISAGAYHSCASYTSGVVRCWGRNSGGRLGDGTSVDRFAPTRVEGVTGATMVTAGGYHSCAVTTSGTLCWGVGSSGQLGAGTRISSITAVKVSGLQ